VGGRNESDVVGVRQRGDPRAVLKRIPQVPVGIFRRKFIGEIYGQRIPQTVLGKALPLMGLPYSERTNNTLLR
jgi:hypothetical protein